MHPQHVSTIWIKMLVAMGGLLLTLVIKENDGDDKPIVHFLPTNISWSFYWLDLKVFNLIISLNKGHNFPR